MNTIARQACEEYLNRRIPGLSPEAVWLFRRLYSHKNPAMDLTKIVAGLTDSQIDRAVEQVQATIERETANAQ